MEENGVSGENHRPVASHWQTSSHNVVSNTTRDNSEKIGGEREEYYWIEPSAVRIVAVSSSMCKSWNVMDKRFLNHQYFFN
jgi:hypothetical protein